MSKTLTDALLVVKNTMSASATIKAWCLANFNAEPRIFIGVDPLELPEMRISAPAIAAIPGRRFRHQDQANRTHEIKIRCAIKHSDTPEESGNVTSWSGLALVDAFANLVESELVVAFNAAGLATIQEPEEGDETIPPFFIARWTFSVLCPTKP